MQVPKRSARSRNLRNVIHSAVVRCHQVAPHLRYRPGTIARTVRRGRRVYRCGAIVDKRTLPVFHRHRERTDHRVASRIRYLERNVCAAQGKFFPALRPFQVRQRVPRAVVPKVRVRVTHRSVALTHIRRHRRIRRTRDRRNHRVFYLDRERTRCNIARGVYHVVCLGVYTPVFIIIRTRTQTALKDRQRIGAVVHTNRSIVLQRHTARTAADQPRLRKRNAAKTAADGPVYAYRNRRRTFNFGVLRIFHSYSEQALGKVVAGLVNVAPYHRGGAYRETRSGGQTFDEFADTVVAVAIILEQNLVFNIRTAQVRIVVPGNVRRACLYRWVIIVFYDHGVSAFALIASSIEYSPYHFCATDGENRIVQSIIVVKVVFKRSHPAVVRRSGIQRRAFHRVRTLAAVRAHVLQAARTLDVGQLHVADGHFPRADRRVAAGVFRTVRHLFGAYSKESARCRAADLVHHHPAIVRRYRGHPEHFRTAFIHVVVQGHIRRTVHKHRLDVVHHRVRYLAGLHVARSIRHRPYHRRRTDRQDRSRKGVRVRCIDIIVRTLRALAVVVEAGVRVVVHRHQVTADARRHRKGFAHVAIDRRLFVVFQRHF
ncbi:MAG: hypothetical protein EPGJADBJ_04413 [Saprospiraceae bacterium]|nr:hypothetical protein [Saprospiraceae bacterium]